MIGFAACSTRARGRAKPQWVIVSEYLEHLVRGSGVEGIHLCPAAALGYSVDDLG
jgi:hypothetical protein